MFKKKYWIVYNDLVEKYQIIYDWLEPEYINPQGGNWYRTIDAKNTLEEATKILKFCEENKV